MAWSREVVRSQFSLAERVCWLKTDDSKLTTAFIAKFL